MILDLNNQEQVAKYEEFVRNNPNGRVTQDVLWGKVKNNWQGLYVYREDEQQNITAAMSILYIEALPGKIFAYCSKGPVVDFNDAELVNSLVEEAVANLPENTFLLRMDPEIFYSDELNAKYEQLGYVTRNVNITHMHGNIQPRKNVVLYFDGRTTDKIENEEDLMLHFKRSTRTAIRKAIKTGLTVTVGTDHKAIDAFYDVYKKMAEKRGITYRPIEYFYRMSDVFADTGRFKVFLAHLTDEQSQEDDVVASAGIGFSYGDEVWYMYAGLDRQYDKYYAPHLVQYEMMKWALEEKKVQYDFGGVNSFDESDGLYSFKHRFAYHDEPAEYIGEIDKVLDQQAYDEYLKNFE